MALTASQADDHLVGTCLNISVHWRLTKWWSFREAETPGSQGEMTENFDYTALKIKWLFDQMFIYKIICCVLQNMRMLILLPANCPANFPVIYRWWCVQKLTLVLLDDCELQNSDYLTFSILLMFSDILIQFHCCLQWQWNRFVCYCTAERKMIIRTTHCFRSLRICVCRVMLVQIT